MRAETQPIPWGAEALWEQLVPLLPGLSVEIVPRLTSTNTTLLERARAAPDARTGSADAVVRRSVESAAFGRRAIDLQPCLLVAEEQSAGRGRQGRPWQSVPGASLTFSFGLPLAVADWSGLSLAVGVALCEALAPVDAGALTTGAQIGLKWPNDLWLMDGPVRTAARGRKLGGILIETVAAGGVAGSKRLVIIGVGLNVLRFDAADARTGFASLHELDAGATAPTVLAKIALPLVQAVQQFERDGFGAFAERFAAHDLLRGRKVRTTLAEVPEGIARGVSPQGALQVQSASGIASVSSGEVSVRLADDA
ncbi:MAG: biotin--[acetyl-CoA-carboxylase] ligase [Rhizobiales bacterium]|nr:biotin--[acetyl-CoA-carboxylase] ligase [Rhizobacter sp.]